MFGAGNSITWETGGKAIADMFNNYDTMPKKQSVLPGSVLSSLFLHHDVETSFTTGKI